MFSNDKIDIKEDPVYGVQEAAAVLKYKKLKKFRVEIKVY